MGVLDETRWHYRRYKHQLKRRFYELYLTPDLFGGFQVVRVYGSLDSDRCQKCADWFADYADALAHIEALHTHRIDARHYTLFSRLDPEQSWKKASSWMDRPSLSSGQA